MRLKGLAVLFLLHFGAFFASHQRHVTYFPAEIESLSIDESENFGHIGHILS